MSQGDLVTGGILAGGSPPGDLHRGDLHRGDLTLESCECYQWRNIMEGETRNSAILVENSFENHDTLHTAYNKLFEFETCKRNKL